MADLAYIEISPHTIPHIFARHPLPSQAPYPLRRPWAWERKATAATLPQVLNLREGGGKGGRGSARLLPREGVWHLRASAGREARAP